MRYSEKLRERYIDELQLADWERLRREALDNPGALEGGDPDEIYGSVWLGSITALMPSGKYYMPWTTNQTARDVIRDQAFTEALEEVADKYDMFITEFNDSLYACLLIDEAETEDEE